jgi:hypothetical protein
MITAAPLTLPHLRPSVTRRQVSTRHHVRTAAVICGYVAKVTIYRCRISELNSINVRDLEPRQINRDR